MPVLQRMASIQVLPLGNYNGTHVAGPVDIADDVTACDISIARCTTANPLIWPLLATGLAILPEVSVDGGVTWTESGAANSVGGISPGKFGIGEAPFTIAGGGLPAAVNGITRQYKCTTVITNGPLRSAVTIEVS